MSFPPVVTFYANMAIEAARHRSGIGGAWRLWVIAKALDVIGLGMVRRRDLRAYVLQLGLQPRTWQRWLTDARTAGFIQDIQKGKEWWLILPAAGRVALAMGCSQVGRKITMDAGELIGPAWRARVYTAWEDGKQISREKIQKSQNIPVRTQTYRAGQMGEEYTRERNYSRSAMKADKFQLIQELTKHKAPFVSGNGFVYWRLPDRRQSAIVLHSAKGRARKVNQFIRTQADPKGLSYMRRALTTDRAGEWVRLFCLTDAQRKQSERRIAKQDKRINELYQHAHEAPSGAQVWQHCPMV